MNKDSGQPRRFSAVWVLAGGYLAYLGVQQFLGLYRGEAGYPVVTAISGIAFAAIGGAVILREWKFYRQSMENKNDPPDSDEGEEEPEEREEQD